MSIYIRNSLWMSVEKLFVLLGGLAVYVIVSNYLGAYEFGKITFGVTLASIPIVMSQWGANHIISNMAIKSPHQTVRYINATKNLRALIYLIVTIIVTVILFSTPKYRDDFLLLFLVIIFHFHLGLDISQFYFNGTLNSKVNAISSFYSKLLSISIRLSLVLFKLNPIWFSIPYLINNYIVYKLRQRRLPKLKFTSKKYNRNYLGLGRAFTISALFTLIYTRVNEFILASMLGYSEIAIYNVALTMSFAWAFIPQAIGLTFITKALKIRGKVSRADFFSFVFVLMTAISIPAILFYFLFSTFFINLLFNNEYILAAKLIPILSLCCLVSALGVVNNRVIGSYKGGGGYLYKKVLCCAVFATVSGYYLISEFGLLGAGYSLFITELISLSIGNYFFSSGVIFRMHLRLFTFSYWRSLIHYGFANLLR